MGNFVHSGDLEFEAKVFYSLFAYMDGDILESNPLMEFYYNPNCHTYRAAMEYYYKNYKYYYDNFPITPEGYMDYSERIKHIK